MLRQSRAEIARRACDEDSHDSKAAHRVNTVCPIECRTGKCRCAFSVMALGLSPVTRSSLENVSTMVRTCAEVISI